MNAPMAFFLGGMIYALGWLRWHWNKPEGGSGLSLGLGMFLSGVAAVGLLALVVFS